ncbi:MAG: sel1 repeat family protein [Rhodospirillales bacterium]|nr:sel1 repeat family protein [Rhodospirillales bacterium]
MTDIFCDALLFLKKQSNMFIIIIAILCAPGVCISADFQKGNEAALHGDYATAHKEWEPLAEAGNPDAQLKLGMLYENGAGVKQDYLTAFKWYELSSEQGLAEAQYRLGILYGNGKGTPKDEKAGLEMIKLAAMQGFIKAQYAAGLAFYEGFGVKKSLIKAHAWFSVAESGGLNAARVARETIEENMSRLEIGRAKILVLEWNRKW